MSTTAPLSELINNNFWSDIPVHAVTREGNKIITKDDVWHLPYSMRNHASLNFGRIKRLELKWVTKRYVLEKLQVTSTHAGYSSFQDIQREFLRYQEEYGLDNNINNDVAKQKLIYLVESSISKARNKHKLWALYRPIQWYIWCAENYPELGFCPAYAMELEGMSIPGNPKGEAVRMEDPAKGPLHRSLELPLLISVMKKDISLNFEHLQQKAAVALSIAFGRNPANLTHLKCSDLVNITHEVTDPCYVIRMPRIKKRQLNPRDDLMDEYLDPEFAKHILQLIEANEQITTNVYINNQQIEVEKPLFIKARKNLVAVASGLIEETFNMASEDISQLLKGFVKRHNIISPITGELLYICTRRLRYTLATCLASEGISQRELARILDHTDTQHVQVYFDVANSIVEYLDKAVAKGFSKYLNFFRGKIIDDDNQAINGNRSDKHLIFVKENEPTNQTEIGICGQSSICHLDPPFSCYLCPKFQPYRHADHEHVLECLLESRDERIKKYENSRIGIQLDHVIIAVAQVAEQCKLEVYNA